jgi:cyanophycinase-like exopeptidase
VERLLVIIGSGEMAPGMRRVHREVIARLAGPGGAASALNAVAIDTPYGFQPNADALTGATLDYFARLGLAMVVASLRRGDAGDLVHEAALARIRAAEFVFSGPGSPTYALRQWHGTAVPELLAEKLLGGGALVVASAAALTLGRLTVPVYEIYKSGADPFWADGLDILSRVGLDVAVVPHWDNREGGDHDTRYCFLGEQRLAFLEQLLPADTFLLGVDEHTALLVDLERRRAWVHGRGAATVRRAGRETAFAAGSEFDVDELRAAAGVADRAPASQVAVPASAFTGTDDDNSSLARRVLQLEAEMRTMSERAALVAPLVDALVELRTRARQAGNWEQADQIRDRLLALGVELSDSADGRTAHRLPRTAG